MDRAKAARYGLNSGDVNSVIQAALGGTVATTVLEGDRQFSLAVRYPPEYRDSIEKIRNIKVAYQTSSGANAYIPLSELATITLDTGASWIYHENGERFIPVKFSVRGRDLGSTVAEAQKRIAENVKLPSGYHLVWSGEFGELQAAKERLEMIVPVSLVLILGLLYSLFNSAAGVPADAHRNSLHGRRRRAGALFLRPQFQHLRRHRFRFVVWRVGDDRHSVHHLLQPGQAPRRHTDGRHVPRRIHSDAAAVDDESLRRHRPFPGGDFDEASAARCSVRSPPWWWAAC